MPGNLGPYEIRSELGRGAMAIVWRAYDPVLAREVALKESVVPHGADSTSASELSARFVREARTVARLSHPSIVKVHGADIYDGRPVIAMELVQGETLTGVLSRGPLAPTAALGLFEELLDAVGYAHSNGVVHRDIKPDNIFITVDGHVKLADFGIAHLSTGTALTQAGTIMGTPGYMSPEQLLGHLVDSRADIFALGVVLFEMLTGGNPFGAGQGVPITNVAYRVVHGPTPVLPESVVLTLPRDIRSALYAALAKDPAARFADTRSFGAALAGRGRMPSPVAPGGQAGTQRAGTFSARVQAVKRGTTLPWIAAQPGGPSWLTSWVPYAAIILIGLVIVGVLLAQARGGVVLAVDNGVASSQATATSDAESTGATEVVDSGEFWTRITVSGDAPVSRSGAGFAYDSADRVMYLFGGTGSRPMDDLWAYDVAANSWTELSPTGIGPSERAGCSLVYDAEAKSLLLFGGDGSGLGDVMGDCWAYSIAGNTWSQIAELYLDELGSSARHSQSVVFEPSSGVSFLFGGVVQVGSMVGSTNDLWKYSAGEATWSEVEAAGDSPGARDGHAMVLNPVDERIYMFAGGNSDGEYLNDLWAYDLGSNSWIELSSSGAAPAARSGHTMACDPATGAVLLFGGGNGSEVFSDLWKFDSAAKAWTNLSPDGEMPQGGSQLFYDEESGRMYLIGGGSSLDEIWTFDPGASA